MNLNYAIFRSEPIMTIPDLAQIGSHNKREKKAYQSNKDIKINLSKNNIELVPLNVKYVKGFDELTKEYKKEHEERMKTERNDRKKRYHEMLNSSKNVVADELVMTASHNFFKDMSREQIKEWADTCMEFVYNDLGYKKEQILHATVHLDELTPHIHCVVVPLVKKYDKRTNTERYTISKKTYIHDKMHLSELQDKYHERMTNNGYDLLRGESKFGREYIPVNELKRMTRMLNKDLTIKHEKLNNSLLKLEDNMKSNKDLLLDKEHVKIKKETFENIKDVISETKEVLKVQPKLESAFAKVDHFNKSYTVLENETKKYKKEISILNKQNEALEKENRSLKDIIKNLLERIKNFFRGLLLDGDKYTKAVTVDEIEKYYDRKDFDNKDVYHIAKETTEEEELFDYASIPDYMKSFKNKYSKINDKNRDDDFEL